MDHGQKKRKIARRRRQLHVRKGVRGTCEKPRLTVFRSNRHFFAQIIDDEKGETLLGFGTMSKTLKDTKFNKKSKEAVSHLGAQMAEKAKEKNIQRVVFDRGRYKYHGLLAEFASAARKAGLQF